MEDVTPKSPISTSNTENNTHEPVRQELHKEAKTVTHRQVSNEGVSRKINF